MFVRRNFIRVMAASLAAGTAGCSSVPFLGSDQIAFEATRATVSGSARDDTGYQETDVREDVIERTFEAGDQTQDVVVTNWQAEYDKAVDLSEIGVLDGPRARAAVFTALSTPQVSVLERSFNPVGDMSSRALAERVQDRYDGVSGVEQVGEDDTLVAGQETTAGEFRTEAELSEVGASVELALHITEPVKSGDDFLVTVGGYPRRLRATERDSVFRMMEAVDHGG